MNNKVMILLLVLLAASCGARAEYVPFTGSEPGALYLYHLDGPGDGTASVNMTSGISGGATLAQGGTHPLLSLPSSYGNSAYFEFSAGNSWAYASTGDVGVPSTTTLYIDLWAKPYLQKDGILLCKDKAFALYSATDGSLTSFLGTGAAWDSNSFLTTSTGVVTGFAWNHIVLKYDGATVTLLVNDSVVGSKAWAGTVAGGGTFTLGSWQNAGGDYYGGMMDEVFVSTNIPEPTTMGLLGIGGLLTLVRRKRS